MQPEVFRFREDIVRAAASRTRRRVLVSVAAAAAAVAVIWGTTLRPQGSSARTLAFALAFLAVLAFLSLRRRLRRVHARWTSFEVRVEDDAIGREVSGFAPVRIVRSEVAGIDEGPAGLVVRDRAGKALLVPRDVDGFERVRELLATWRT